MPYYNCNIAANVTLSVLEALLPDGTYGPIRKTVEYPITVEIEVPVDADPVTYIRTEVDNRYGNTHNSVYTEVCNYFANPDATTLQEFGGSFPNYDLDSYRIVGDPKRSYSQYRTCDYRRVFFVCLHIVGKDGVGRFSDHYIEAHGLPDVQTSHCIPQVKEHLDAAMLARKQLGLEFESYCIASMPHEVYNVELGSKGIL